MKNINIISLLCISIALFMSCSRVSVGNIQYNENTDFRKYKTYEFFELDIVNKTKLTPQTPNIEKLKNAIRIELNNRDMEEKNNADIKVNIGITLEEAVTTRETDIRDAPPYMGQRNYSWKVEEIVVERYEKGTAIVDLVDVMKNELIWQGSIIGVITDDQEKMESRIYEGVKKLFKKYPIQP